MLYPYRQDLGNRHYHRDDRETPDEASQHSCRRNPGAFKRRWIRGHTCLPAMRGDASATSDRTREVSVATDRLTLRSAARLHSSRGSSAALMRWTPPATESASSAKVAAG